MNGGASPPAAAKRGLGLRSVVVSLAGRNSGGCDSRRLHHFHGSQALIVKPPALNRQNPEHYRGGLPWLSSAAVSAAPPYGEGRGCESRLSSHFRGVAEQQLQRAVNAPPSRAAEVQVLPPRPILFRQSVGSDVSQWYWEERSATLRAGSILCGRGGTSRRAGPRSRRAQAHEGATPSVRTNFRGVVGTEDTAGLNPAGPSGSVPVQPRPPRPIMRPCVE